VSDDPDKTEKVAARALDTAAEAEAGAQAARTDAEVRAAEIREEVAITDQRRAEEEEAKAEEAITAAQEAEAEKEEKRHEAERRRKAAAEESQRAREQAASSAAERGSTPLSVSGASVGSPGFGSDPRAAAAASHTSRVRTSAGTVKDPDAGPEKPEIEVAAAFAGAFLLARILKKIAG
jgi:hypothetical protein